MSSQRSGFAKIAFAAMAAALVGAYAVVPSFREALGGELVGALIGLAVLTVVVSVFSAKLPPGETERRMRQHGVPMGTEGWSSAAAVVRGLRHTGRTYGRHVLLEFQLVTPGGPITHRQVVPPLALARLRDGESLVLWVSPANATEVFIDWEATFPGSDVRATAVR